MEPFNLEITYLLPFWAENGRPGPSVDLTSLCHPTADLEEQSTPLLYVGLSSLLPMPGPEGQTWSPNPLEQGQRCKNQCQDHHIIIYCNSILAFYKLLEGKEGKKGVKIKKKTQFIAGHGDICRPSMRSSWGLQTPSCLSSSPESI